jgi:hypothetical protein
MQQVQQVQHTCKTCNKGKTMATNPLNFKTPLCEFRWVNISGEGKLKYDRTNSLDKEDRANYQYVVTAVLTEEQADKVRKQLQEFWKNNKPQGATKQKYEILKPLLKKVTDEHGKVVTDEDGEPLREQEKDSNGNLLYEMMFKTGAVWPDGTPQVIKTLRANGSPLNLGERRIGNGTIGVVHGKIGINGFKGNEGLLAFLSGVQIKKFVEYSDDDIEADDLGDDEGLDDADMDAVDISNEAGPEV